MPAIKLVVVGFNQILLDDAARLIDQIQVSFAVGRYPVDVTCARAEKGHRQRGDHSRVKAKLWTQPIP